ncbi:MAG: hypothetical protein AB7O62_08950 [Pirellulales bacterium]
MIAPLRPPEPPRPWRLRRPSETLRKARRLVADTLLPRRMVPGGRGPTPWKAWLAAGWMCLVLAAFVITWWQAR